MENQRKWTGWLLISIIVLVAGIALVMTTLASPQSEPYPSEQPTESLNPPTGSPAPQQAQQMQPASGRTANASVIGYAGPVLVRLTLDEQGAIEALDIGGARFQETEGLGSKVRDAAFVQPLIGKTPPLALGEDVDAIAGATRSSTAAVEAINAAHAFLTEEKAQTDSN